MAVPAIVPHKTDTYSAVLADWLKHDQGENRTHYEIKRLVTRETKAWNDRPIGSITRADVRAVLDSIAERGAKTMSRRCQSHLHKLFGWAAGRDLIPTNPVAGLPRAVLQAAYQMLHQMVHRLAHQIALGSSASATASSSPMSMDRQASPPMSMR